MFQKWKFSIRKNLTAEKCVIKINTHYPCDNEPLVRQNQLRTMRKVNPGTKEC